jgi:hypothetical protein
MFVIVSPDLFRAGQPSRMNNVNLQHIVKSSCDAQMKRSDAALLKVAPSSPGH